MPVRKIRIALIEDSPTVRFSYKLLFEKAGFEVFEADNAKDGWDLICNKKPDVIVLDMIMPKIPGIELLKRIRSVEFSKDIPVLVLTSIKEEQQVKEIFQSGADHYCLKGMDSPEVIRETIYKLLKAKEEKRVRQFLEGEKQKGQEPQSPEDPGLDRFFWYF